MRDQVLTHLFRVRNVGCVHVLLYVLCDIRTCRDVLVGAKNGDFGIPHPDVVQHVCKDLPDLFWLVENATKLKRLVIVFIRLSYCRDFLLQFWALG